MSKWWAPLAFVVSAPAAPASARDLPAAAGQGWKHAATGVVLPFTLAGLPRLKPVDSGTKELDVAADYYGNGDAEVTVFLFHPGVDDVALWFDRVDTVVRARDVFADAMPTTPNPLAFARPGSGTADSLKRVYVPRRGPFRATAAALMPVGEWLVSVRISSKVDEPPALADKLDTVIRAIRFPAVPDARPVTPVADCPAPLQTRHARLVKPDGASALMGALLATAVGKESATSDAKPAKPVAFCRAGHPTAAYTAYQGNNGESAYWIAFNDAGIAAFVSPGLSGLMGKTTEYQVQLLTFDAVGTYASFDALPDPAQVIDLIDHSDPLSRAAGNNVTINAKAMGK